MPIRNLLPTLHYTHPAYSSVVCLDYTIVSTAYYTKARVPHLLDSQTPYLRGQQDQGRAFLSVILKKCLEEQRWRSVTSRRYSSKSTVRNFLEGVWNIDILSPEGFEKMKEVAGDINVDYYQKRCKSLFYVLFQRRCMTVTVAELLCSSFPLYLPESATSSRDRIHLTIGGCASNVKFVGRVVPIAWDDHLHFASNGQTSRKAIS